MTEQALTKKQLEALWALHYGELWAEDVRCRGRIFKRWVMPVEGRAPVDISGRVMKLCQKRMCRYMAVERGLDRSSMPLVLTPRGEAELAKHKEV